MDWLKSTGTLHGGPTVAVPGEIRGFWELHKKYGKAPWARLFAPSIKLAREGFPLGKDLHEVGGGVAWPQDVLTPPAQALTEARDWLYNDAEFVKTYTSNGAILAAGATLRRPDYAATLELIAAEGPDALYKGEIGAAIVDAVRARGGRLSVDDLKNYSVQWAKPLVGSYRGHRVITPGAPASGAILLSALGTLDALPPPKEGAEAGLHATVEALRWAYGARLLLGDPDFVPGLEGVQADLIAPAAGAERAAKIGEKTEKPETYLPSTAAAKNDAGTSNISAVDASGLVATLTTTIGSFFGSRILVPGTGVHLNDSLNDFSLEGVQNWTGYPPAEPNYAAGGKRPLSSSTPYVLETDGVPRLVGGAAGGSTIIGANVQVIRNVVDFGHSALEALAAPRLHDQVLPDVTALERPSDRGARVEGFDEATADALAARGHKIEWWDKSRSTPVAIRVLNDGTFDAAGDARKFEGGARGGSVFYAK
ncbi:hypothetical protein VHUM_01051 [Vanrija humicola]|uniref:Gamma-glutamyltransferase n=1 Tax=Vanrija humicola TaxID=5417 RepID=A0A7D8V1P0_VANHU|nr:hypothetical protein VHUM_01051 [Vanrija humicola]